MPSVKPLPVAAAVLLVATLWRRRRSAAQRRQPPPRPSEWLEAAVAPVAINSKDAAPSSTAGDSSGPRGAAAAALQRAKLAHVVLGVLSAGAVAAVMALLVERGDLYMALAVLVAWVLQALHVQVPVANGRQQPVKEAEDSGAVVPAAPRPQLPPLAGTWMKDHSASDSMDQIMDVMRINGLLRTAVRLLRGLEIKLDDSDFSFAVFSVVKWFKIAESYKLDGSVCRNRRRDLRGRQRGVARLTQHGTLVISYEWDSPIAGRGEDEFVVSDGRLHVITTNWVGGQEVKYTQVYVRR